MERSVGRDAGILRFRVGGSLRGLRLSRCLAEMVEGLSVRSAKQYVDRGWVFINRQRARKASVLVQEGDWIEAHLDRLAEPPSLCGKDIVWEGEGWLALNKPPGLLVYGSRGATQDTVLPQLERVLRETGRWRAGRDRLALVHRLDRDTSGLLVVARDERAAAVLEGQFRARGVEKRYLVIVNGVPRATRFHQASVVRARRPAPGPGGGTGREATKRTGGARRPRTGITEFRVLKRFSGCALLEARPVTGRTHQIRVHLAQLGHPVLGDVLYGPRVLARGLFRSIPRQMLHAWVLGIQDPDTGRSLVLRAPLPPDMKQVLNALKGATGRAGTKPPLGNGG